MSGAIETRYIRNAEIEAYAALGWRVDLMADLHHCVHMALASWDMADGEPPIPAGRDAE